MVPVKKKKTIILSSSKMLFRINYHIDDLNLLFLLIFQMLIIIVNILVRSVTPFL